MNTLTHLIGSVANVRFLGALRGGMTPVQRCVAYDATHMERVDRADSGIRAARFAAAERGWSLESTERVPAEQTPRLKGVVGWCPRSVLT